MTFFKPILFDLQSLASSSFFVDIKFMCVSGFRI